MGPIDLVVNAGGQNRRMGRVKALLPMPPNDTPLILHIINRLAPLVDGKVMVVTNDPQIATTVLAASAKVLKQIDLLPDRWREGGALGGVVTGLAACRGWAMVVACDMPLVDPAIFTRLIERARQEPTLDAIVPRLNGQAQPFHALWHQRAVSTLDALLDEGMLAVNAALTHLNVAWLGADALVGTPIRRAFMNINTPGEWQSLLDQWREEASDERETGR